MSMTKLEAMLQNTGVTELLVRLDHGLLALTATSDENDKEEHQHNLY